MRKPHLFALALLLCLSGPAFASAPRDGIGDPLLPNAGNYGYDVQHYTLDVVVESVESGEIEATTTVEFVATQPMGAFNLDFSPLDIEQVTVNGEPAEYALDGTELVITPDEPLEVGASYETAVTYAGDPDRIMNPMIGRGGWTTYREGIYVAGEPFSASSFMPINEHPRDKATYTVRVTVPEPYFAISNGLLVETLEGDDTATYVWQMNQPMASYLLTIGIGEFDILEQTGPNDLPITTYLPQGTPERLRVAFERQPEIIEFMSERFGPYPFESAGGLVVNDPRMSFALETQSLPIYGIGMLQFAGEQVVVHELAHQWFGNTVSLYEWQDIWLNEGFASYAEALWIEHIGGAAPFDRYLRNFYLTARMSDVLPGAPPLRSLFDGAVYHRGALTLHALRVEVGDDTFFEILQTYVEQFQHSNATTEDFIAGAETVSGQDLGPLFDAWLFGETVPPFPRGA